MFQNYRLTAREEAAVSEWLESGFPFHSMRDHRQHGTEILGGMWGGRLEDSTTREKFSKRTKELINDVSICK